MSNNSTWFVPAAEIFQAQMVTRNVLITMATITFVILVLEAINLTMRWNELQKNKVVRRTTCALIAVSTASLLYLSNSIGFYSTDWTGRNEGCDLFAKLGLVVTYLFVKIWIYLFLFVRMKVSHDALRLNSFLPWAARWIVFLSIIVGVPTIFWPLGGYFYHGRITPEGICVQYWDTSFAVLFFVSMDTVLNVAVTYLFVAPLLKHATSKVLSKNSAEKTMRVAKSNLLFSLLMSTTTLASLIHQAFNGGYNDPDDSLIYTHLFASSDIFVAEVLCHVMTFVWVPPKCGRLMVSATDVPSSRQLSGKIDQELVPSFDPEAARPL